MRFAIFLTTLMLSFFAFAQVEVVIIPPETNEGFLQWFLSAIQTPVGGLALAAMVVQGIWKFLGTPMVGELTKAMSAKAKITVILLLSVSAAVLAGMAGPQHLTFLAALKDGAVMTALMGYGHQWLTIWFPGAEDKK